MPKKVRELKRLLLKAGFVYRSAKGSHSRWYHPLLPQNPITISGNDGDDAKRYLEQQVEQTLIKLTNIQRESE